MPKIKLLKYFSAPVFIFVFVILAANVAAQIPRNVLNQAKSRTKSVTSSTKNRSDTSGPDNAGFERREE